MEKLKLDLDSLEVESFASVGADGAHGTVLGLESTMNCPTDTCGTTVIAHYCDPQSGLMDCEFSAGGSCVVGGCDSVIDP